MTRVEFTGIVSKSDVGVTLRFPDIPDLSVKGDDWIDVVDKADAALQAFIRSRVEAGKDLPFPSENLTQRSDDEIGRFRFSVEFPYAAVELTLRIDPKLAELIVSKTRSPAAFISSAIKSAIEVTESLARKGDGKRKPKSVHAHVPHSRTASPASRALIAEKRDPSTVHTILPRRMGSVLTLEGDRSALPRKATPTLSRAPKTLCGAEGVP